MPHDIDGARFQAPVLVNGALRMKLRQIERPARLGRPGEKQARGAPILRDHIHIADRTAIADLDELMRRFGAHASSEAARRAHHSRSLGNLVHYCRWRQIERMIERLGGEEAAEETRH